MKKTLNKALEVIKAVYTPLSLMFIGYFFWLNRGLIADVLAVSNVACLFPAVVCWSVLHLLSPLAPRIVFTHLGSRLNYKQLLTIHIKQIPARYLPGGVWHTVGRMSAYHLSGVSKKSVALYAVIETASPLVVTLFIGGACLWISGVSREWALLFGAAALLQLGVIVLLPLAAHAFRLVQFTRQRLLGYGLFLGIAVIFWLVATVSFLLYYYAFAPAPLQAGGWEPLHIIGSYLFSWGVGYAAVFAPQGIGVFEVVAGKLIKLPVDLGGAVVFMAGFRLVAFAADLGVWGLYKSACFICQIKSGCDAENRG